jgi:hypothetical protein
LNKRLGFAAAVLMNLVVLGLPTTAAADAWWAHPANVDDVQPHTRVPTTVFAVGDSVMLGASGALRQAMPSIEIDAVVGRQASTGIGIVEGRLASGQVPDVVIFGLGTNGPLTRGQIDEAMAALGSVPRVVLVNNSMPRDWETANNALLVDAVQRYPNAVLADWHSRATADSDLLTPDRIHLRESGAEAYAALVAPYAIAPLPAVSARFRVAFW